MDQSLCFGRKMVATSGELVHVKGGHQSTAPTSTKSASLQGRTIHQAESFPICSEGNLFFVEM